jgi:hypothetical protein
MVHDDVSADTCDRLFNVNLHQAQRTAKRPRTPSRTKGKGIKRRAT